MRKSEYSLRHLRAAVYQAIKSPSSRSLKLIMFRRSAKNRIWDAIGALSVTAIFTDDLQNRFKVITWNILILIGYAVIALYITRLVLLLLDARNVFFDTTSQKRRALALRGPLSESTKTFVESKSIGEVAVGTAVEVFTHPYLGPDIAHNGWEVDRVKIIDSHNVLRNTLPYSGNAFEEFGEDNTKYTLQSFTFPFTDASDQLKLKVARTTWHDAKISQKILKANTELRHALISPSRLDNKVPSLLCLHVVALTAENDFIVFRRSPDAQFHKRKLSISFEEQFAQEDMLSGEEKRAERWFQRAICEELFPLSGAYNHEEYRSDVWKHASSFIEFFRIWACILEEDCANVSLVGVCRLNVSTADLLDICDEMQLKFSSRRDREGDLCVMTLYEIQSLLLTGKSTYRKLTHYSSGREIVKNLHPTSVYRALLVYSCLSAGRKTQ